MKKHVFLHRFLIIIVSVAMLFSLTSCAQQKKPIPKASKNEEKANKPPKELEELSKAVEKIEKTLSEMYERNKKPLFIQQEEIAKQAKKEEQKGQGGQGGGAESGGGGGQGSEQGGGGGQGGGDQKGSGQAQQATPVELVTPQNKLAETQYETQQMKLEVERANLEQFEELKKDVMELHALWNAYEAKAITQFVMQTSIVDFEESLNSLTKSVEARDIMQSLLDVTQLYKYLPDFMMAYATEFPPELDKLRFGAKKITLLGEKGEFDAAMQTLDYLSGVWLLTRPRLKQDSIDIINQFEFAASDLKRAIEAKNPTIMKAKSEVILKVADELEKANKEKK